MRWYRTHTGHWFWIERSIQPALLRWMDTLAWRGLVTPSTRLPAFSMPVDGRLVVNPKGRRLIERLGDTGVRWQEVSVRVVSRRSWDALAQEPGAGSAQDRHWSTERPVGGLAWQVEANAHDQHGTAGIGSNGDVLIDEDTVDHGLPGTHVVPGTHVLLARRKGFPDPVMVVSAGLKQVMERASALLCYHDAVFLVRNY